MLAKEMFLEGEREFVWKFHGARKIRFLAEPCANQEENERKNVSAELALNKCIKFVLIRSLKSNLLQRLVY